MQTETGRGSDMKWKFSFHNGGEGRFLMAFLQCMKAQRRYQRAVASEVVTAEARPFTIDAQCVVGSSVDF